MVFRTCEIRCDMPSRTDSMITSWLRKRVACQPKAGKECGSGAMAKGTRSRKAQSNQLALQRTVAVERQKDAVALEALEQRPQARTVLTATQRLRLDPGQRQRSQGWDRRPRPHSTGRGAFTGSDKDHRQAPRADLDQQVFRNGITESSDDRKQNHGQDGRQAGEEIVVQTTDQGLGHDCPEAGAEHYLDFRPERDALVVPSLDGKVGHGRPKEDRDIMEAGRLHGHLRSMTEELDAAQNEQRGKTNGKKIGRENGDNTGDRRQAAPRPRLSIRTNRRHSFRNVMNLRNCQRTLPTTKTACERFLVALHHK